MAFTLRKEKKYISLWLNPLSYIIVLLVYISVGMSLTIFLCHNAILSRSSSCIKYMLDNTSVVSCLTLSKEPVLGYSIESFFFFYASLQLRGIG